MNALSPPSFPSMSFTDDRLDHMAATLRRAGWRVTEPADAAWAGQFSDHLIARFLAHVVPRLDDLIPFAALYIVADEETYAAAFDRLWRLAWVRGGSFLPDQAAFDLEDWLHRRLLAAVEHCESEILQRVIRDIAEHDAMRELANG